MTPRSRYPTPPTIRRYRVQQTQRSSTAAITLRLVVLAAVATLIIGSLLAVQMASGSDPALGPKALAQGKQSGKSQTAGGSPTPSDLGTDPYANGSGDEGNPYGDSAQGGYSYGSTAQSAPAPVTSSTS